MRRTHAMMPLTRQEEAVGDLLIEERLSFASHHVFELRPPQRGLALSELRRRSAYMNFRFGLLKATLPKLACGAFIEAPYENQDKLATQLVLIVKVADFLARSGEELREGLGKLRTQSPQAGPR